MHKRVSGLIKTAVLHHERKGGPGAELDIVACCMAIESFISRNWMWISLAKYADIITCKQRRTVWWAIHCEFKSFKTFYKGISFLSQGKNYSTVILRDTQPRKVSAASSDTWPWRLNWSNNPNYYLNTSRRIWSNIKILLMNLVRLLLSIRPINVI